MEEEMPQLEVSNWDEIGEKLELKKSGGGGVSPEFEKLFGMIKAKSIVLVEVDSGGVLAVFNYFFDNAAHSGGYVVPILGATTPYDLEAHKDSIGVKSAAWVTSAPTDDAWINDKFNIIRPSNLFEITPFIRTIALKTKEKVCFVSDMLDEVYDLVAEKEVHAFLSRLHTTMKSTTHTLILIIQPSLYGREYLAMIERYADAKITFGEHIDYIDFATNAKERVK